MVSPLTTSSSPEDDVVFLFHSVSDAITLASIALTSSGSNSSHQQPPSSDKSINKEEDEYQACLDQIRNRQPQDDDEPAKPTERGIRFGGVCRVHANDDTAARRTTCHCEATNKSFEVGLVVVGWSVLIQRFSVPSSSSAGVPIKIPAILFRYGKTSYLIPVSGTTDVLSSDCIALMARVAHLDPGSLKVTQNMHTMLSFLGQESSLTTICRLACLRFHVFLCVLASARFCTRAKSCIRPNHPQHLLSVANFCSRCSRCPT